MNEISNGTPNLFLNILIYRTQIANKTQIIQNILYDIDYYVKVVSRDGSEPSTY